jgi:predicted TIM-barrel fold metal-dependent hydrolase
MLAQMSYAGVDHCLLQAGMHYGFVNNSNAFAQHQYPDRFTGLFQVDEPMADTARWMKEVERAHGRLGLRGLYYALDDFSRYGFPCHFDDPKFDAFWELVASFEIFVFFEATPVPGYDAASYVANLVRLDGLLQRFPKVRWLLASGPPAQFFAPRGRWTFPAEVERAYSRDNLRVEAVFPVAWGGVWDYPYPEAQALIAHFRDEFGAHKLVWGSDMPNVERFCTYRQSLEYVLRYCESLSSREKDLILGGNIAEMCGIW